MKRTIHILMGITLFFHSGISQSFQDDFDDLNEKNWVPWGEYTIWKAEEGILKLWINSPPGFKGDARPTIELLQFKESSGSYENIDADEDEELIQRQIRSPGYENFTITLQNIGGVQQRDFGIALGRRFPDERPFPNGEEFAEIIGTWPFYYLFLLHTSYSVSFGKGGVAFGESSGRVPLNPDTIWDTQELESMELRFNKGHIQWFADGEKRADFEDPEFPSVEILGFVVIGNGLRVKYAWVDSFRITESVLSVSPQAKLATTWGQLKQQK